MYVTRITSSAKQIEINISSINQKVVDVIL